MRPTSLHTALSRATSFATPERALGRAQEALGDARARLSTGRRIGTPSDDPTGFVRAKALGRHRDRLAQYERSIDAATLWTDRTMTELDALSNLFTQANEVGLRGANGIHDADALADQIEGFRDEAIARLRATSNGEYLFAGSQTQTAPLDLDGTTTPGDFSGARTREIAPDQTVQINAVGALDVDGVPAVDRLQALADAIRAGDGDAVRDELDGVRAGVDHYTRLGSQAGEASRRLTAASASVESERIATDELRSQIEDTDLADALGEVQRRQTALEAALRATAATVQPSLLDYLR